MKTLEQFKSEIAARRAAKKQSVHCYCMTCGNTRRGAIGKVTWLETYKYLYPDPNWCIRARMHPTVLP